MRGLKVGAALMASRLLQVIKTRRGTKLPALLIARQKRPAKPAQISDAKHSRVARTPQAVGALTAASSQPPYNPSVQTDLDSWCEQCDALAKETIKSGGLSHDWCIKLYSSGVDRLLEQMPEAWREPALQIAHEIFDYRSPSERQRTIRANADNGLCRHGIAFECCPAGCGEFPDECEEHNTDHFA